MTTGGAFARDGGESSMKTKGAATCATAPTSEGKSKVPIPARQSARRKECRM